MGLDKQGRSIIHSTPNPNTDMMVVDKRNLFNQCIGYLIINKFIYLSYRYNEVSIQKQHEMKTINEFLDGIDFELDLSYNYDENMTFDK